MKKKCLICKTTINSETTLICNNCTKEIEKIKGNKRIKYWKKLGFLKNSNKMTFKEQIEKCDLLEKTYSSKFQKELMEFDEMTPEDQKKDILQRFNNFKKKK